MITFNADEVFEMAETIEANGATFYAKAARYNRDADAAERLEALAEMERGHRRTFHEMREQLGEREKAETGFDPSGPGSKYLGAMVDAGICRFRDDPTQVLEGVETEREILDHALDMEKDSIVFYQAIKTMVPPGAGAERIDAVIAEEMEHIVTLAERIRELES